MFRPKGKRERGGNKLTTYTPGARLFRPDEWTVDGYQVITGKPVHVICDVSTDAGCGSLTKAQAKNHARLIAASPGLLEALKLLYEETADYIRINHLGNVHHNRSMQMAREAIAQAQEGKSST